MKTKIHAAAGALALVTISVFWTTTIWAELFAGGDDIAMVKTNILRGMAVLIPAMIAVGASGFSLGRGWRHPAVARKAARMRIVAFNGIVLLLPAAVYLAVKANAGAFDAWFYAVQVVELIAGAANVTLIALNMRDGLALRRPAV